ncbi:MAG TPA: hypothetical protein V6C76_06150 [Drouetiella sp.]
MTRAVAKTSKNSALGAVALLLCATALNVLMPAALALTPVVTPPTLNESTTSGAHTGSGEASKVADANLVLQANIATVDKLFQKEKIGIHSVVKASVFAFKQGDEKNKYGYERFWLHNGEAIGVEKPNEIELTAGSSVSIQVIQSTQALSESQASANVIMRLVLDTLLHRAVVAGVSVPQDNFLAISQELQSRKAHVLPDGQVAPRDAHVIFQMSAEGSSQKQTLYWI